MLGSGAGSIAVLVLLNYAGMFRNALVICVIALLAAVCLSLFSGRKRAAAFESLLIFTAGLFLPGQYVNSTEKNFTALNTNTSKTLGSFKKEGKSPEIAYTKWNAFSRTDVVKIPELPNIDAVRRFSDFNGNIYDLPQVKIYGEDGRNFVRKTKEKFDMIFLSLVMTKASQAMGYALSENYIYTVEAVQDYLDKLKDNGRVAFLSHDQEDLGKLVSTAILALKNRGIPVKEAPRYIALLTRYMPQDQHGGNTGHIHNPVVIIKNKPFTEGESKQLMDRALKSGNVPLYAPHVYEEGPLQHLREETYSDGSIHGRVSKCNTDTCTWSSISKNIGLELDKQDINFIITGNDSGFFMGMPFPRGLKLLGDGGRGDMIPVMWGINGVMPVIGSVLSIILSMSFGFNGALVAGAIIYVLVSLLNKL